MDQPRQGQKPSTFLYIGSTSQYIGRTLGNLSGKIMINNY